MRYLSRFSSRTCTTVAALSFTLVAVGAEQSPAQQPASTQPASKQATARTPDPCAFAADVTAALKKPYVASKPTKETEEIADGQVNVTKCSYEGADGEVVISWVRGASAFSSVKQHLQDDSDTYDVVRPIKKSFGKLPGFTFGESTIVVQLSKVVVVLDGGGLFGTQNPQLSKLAQVLASKALTASQPKCASLNKDVGKAIGDNVTSSEVLLMSAIAIGQDARGNCSFTTENHSGLMVFLLPADALNSTYRFAEAVNETFVTVANAGKPTVRERSPNHEVALVDLGVNGALRVSVQPLRSASLDASVNIAKAAVTRLSR
jgi:hypothetical protein